MALVEGARELGVAACLARARIVHVSAARLVAELPLEFAVVGPDARPFARAVAIHTVVDVVVGQGAHERLVFETPGLGVLNEPVARFEVVDDFDGFLDE